MTQARRAKPRGRARRGRLAVLGLALALALGFGVARSAHANLEEFSTFDVARAEEDDESLLDHYLTRFPEIWNDEWSRSASGFRTAEGCLTSGQWFIITEFKSRAPLGQRAHLDITYLQHNDNESSYDWVDLSFRFPTRAGSFGVRFRPSYDKSRQDFAALWETGADTTRLHVQLAFQIEDMLNNLWEFRQARVGNASEPYERHPFEPSAQIAWRDRHVQIETGARWSTPSWKRIDSATGPEERLSLWGALGWATVRTQALGLGWEARAWNQQAKSAQDVLVAPVSVALSFRRHWSTELAARRVLNPRLSIEGRWIYEERVQIERGTLGYASLTAVDRGLAAELDWTIAPHTHARFGYLHDQITIADVGNRGWFTWGSRKESRAILGLSARFGRVTVAGVEGIELDAESYQVSFHHDKGFLQLQTTF